MAKKPNVIWNDDSSRPFINPYNFVHLTERVSRGKPENGELSGYVACSLRVEDMLALPDIAENPDPDTKEFAFFSVDGKHIIPGSELRGCIRSAYEAVTESCLSVINSNLLSKRMPRPDNMRVPGLLKKEGGNWVIYKAKYREGKRKLKRVENGVHCDYERDWFKLDEKPVINHTYFYKRANSGAVCTDDDIDKLIDVLDSYYEGIRKKTENDAAALRRIIRDFQRVLREMKQCDDSDEMIPLFYQLDSSSRLVYLSPAQTGRVSFNNTVPSLLGAHSSCSGLNGYCPACSLFGTIGKNAPLASHLRFSDAAGVDGTVQISEKPVILPELSTPKLSTIEFYSDLARNKGISESFPAWDYDSKGVTLRGRKFYFHSLAKPAENPGPRQIATNTALAGSTFTFKVYFDKISKQQLQQLLWVLTIGDNDPGSRQMHKLGRGRPAGFGSVKITVDSVGFRSFDKNSFAYSVDEQSYADYMEDFNCDSAFDKTALRDFKLITDYSLLVREKNGEKENLYSVSYPIGECDPSPTRRKENSENLTAGHQWFSGNRYSENKTKYFRRILPSLPAEKNAEQLRMLARHGSYEQQSGDESFRQSTSERSSDKSRSRTPFFKKEQTYTATITGKHKEGSEIWADLTVEGQPVKIKQWHLPDEIRRDLEGAIQQNKQIPVVFKYKKDSNFIFFVKK